MPHEPPTRCSRTRAGADSALKSLPRSCLAQGAPRPKLSHIFERVERSVV
jgi:hypothetical protein